VKIKDKIIVTLTNPIIIETDKNVYIRYSKDHWEMQKSRMVYDQEVEHYWEPCRNTTCEQLESLLKEKGVLL